MSRIGYPLSGNAWYWTESSYSGPTAAGPYLVSDVILDARLETGDIVKAESSIDSVSAATFIPQPKDYTLHLEWEIQNGDTLVKDCLSRTADGGTCDLESLRFEVAASTCSAQASYYLLKGVKCKSLNLTGSRGNAWVASADFSVKSVTTSTTAQPGAGIPPSSRATAICVWNDGGSIQVNGKDIAFIIDSFDVTIENNLTDYWHVDSREKKYAMPGAKTITGTSDISLDEGGAEWWTQVQNSADASPGNLVMNLGNGVQITLTNIRYDSTSVDINTSGEGMMTSQPFTATDITLGNGFS